MKLTSVLAALALMASLGGCITANESLPWNLMVCEKDDTSCSLYARAVTEKNCEYMRQINLGKDRCELTNCEEPSQDITSYCVKQDD